MKESNKSESRGTKWSSASRRWTSLRCLPDIRRLRADIALKEDYFLFITPALVSQVYHEQE